MADLNGKYNPSAAPNDDFSPIPAGDYTAEITDSSIDEISKNAAKGECLTLIWAITSGDYSNRLIWHRLNLWPENMNNMTKVIEISEGHFASIRAAVNKLQPNDSSELHYIPCTISVSIRTDPNCQYAPQNEVKRVSKLDSHTPAPKPVSKPARATKTDPVTTTRATTEVDQNPARPWS